VGAVTDLFCLALALLVIGHRSLERREALDLFQLDGLLNKVTEPRLIVWDSVPCSVHWQARVKHVIRILLTISRQHHLVDHSAHVALALLVGCQKST
jgi:hypothetical protein